MTEVGIGSRAAEAQRSMLLGDPEVATTAEIIYREFYDVPRIFVVRYQDKQYLFDCRFDESIDEYPDVYEVYVLPNLDHHELERSWDCLYERAQEHLGKVLVRSVVFDESRRRAIEPQVIEELVSAS